MQIESNYVDTEELQSCLADSEPEETIKFYDISKEEYERVVNSKVNIKTKIGKNSPCYEGES